MSDDKKCVCSGCQTQFPEGTELFPKLLLTKDDRVAQELSEDKAKKQLCLACWIEDARRQKPEDLAMVLLGMLKKVAALEARDSYKMQQELLEKMMKPTNPQPYVPWAQPVWIGPHTTPDTAVDPDFYKRGFGMPPQWTYPQAGTVDNTDQVKAGNDSHWAILGNTTVKW